MVMTQLKIELLLMITITLWYHIILKKQEQKVIKEILDEFHFEKNDMTSNERL